MNVYSQNKQLQQTFFFRHTTDFLSDLKDTVPTTLETSSSLNELFLLSSKSSLDHVSLLCDYIKNLKIKRFSEIFFITYKNFFLLPESSVFSKNSFTSTERFNNLKFFFQTIGFNQSIYFL
jgi:hypothetical protein